MKKINVAKLTTEELKDIVYDLGIDEAYEMELSRNELIDYLYDYGEGVYEFE